MHIARVQGQRPPCMRIAHPMYRKSAPGIAMKNFNAFATRLTPSMMLSQVVRLLLSRLLQKLTPHPGVEPGDGNRQLDPSGGAYFVGAIHRDSLICLAHPRNNV